MMIAVVDDMAEDLQSAKNFIADYVAEKFSERSVQVETFIDAEKFLNEFEAGKYDLLVLDIFMKPLNGIQVAQVVRERGDSDAAIIFLTNSTDYILEGYKVFAVGYFLKPIADNVEQFDKTLSHILPKLQQNRRQLSVPMKGGDILIAHKDIRYIDIDEHHHVCIHLPDKKISPHATYEELIDALTDDPRFVECYHRILLNMDFVRYMDSEDFVLHDGTKIPISRRKSKDAKLKYMTHLVEVSSASTW